MGICGDFPVNYKLITCKAYILFTCNIYLCIYSEKLWGFQATCNPHNACYGVPRVTR